MLGPFAIDTYLPSFPDIEQSFSISRELLSQSLAVYLAAFALSTLVWGPLADHFGRRKVLIVSMFLFFLASVACAMSNGISEFLVYRTLQGLTASGGFIASRAMIRDAHEFKAAQKAMSQVMVLFSIAPALAPVLGGWLDEQFGWRSVFWFLSLYALSLVVMSTFVGETLQRQHKQSLRLGSVLSIYWLTLTNRRFLSLIFSLSLTFGGMFLYIAGAPTIIYDFLHRQNDDFGLLFIPMVSGLMLGSFVSGRLVSFWPVWKLVNLGLFIMFLAVAANSLLVMTTAATVITVIGPLVAYAFGLAMILPAISVLILDCFPQYRGTATSMQGFLQMLVNALIASLAVPLLHNHRYEFVVGQVVMYSGGLLLWLLILRDTKNQHPESQGKTADLEN